MYEQNYQSGYSIEEGMRKHAMRTFEAWMGLGLLVTAVSAAFFYFSGIYLRVLFSLGRMYILLMAILQIGVVVAFTSRLTQRPVSTTRMLFLVYSLITGFTFSIIGIAYDPQAIHVRFWDYCRLFWISCCHRLYDKDQFIKIWSAALYLFDCLDHRRSHSCFYRG